MTRTIEQVKALGTAIKTDLSELRRVTTLKAKEKGSELTTVVAEKTAVGLGKLREEGGLVGIAKRSANAVTHTVGVAAGYVGKAGQAAYKTAASLRQEGAQTTYDALKASYMANYQTNQLNPQEVGEKFKTLVATNGQRAMTNLSELVLKGTDAFSRELQKFVPTQEDYLVTIASTRYDISTKVLTKPEIGKVKGFMEDVATALPQNYAGRRIILAEIGANGVNSTEMLAERLPKTYAKISNYL